MVFVLKLLVGFCLWFMSVRKTMRLSEYGN